MKPVSFREVSRLIDEWGMERKTENANVRNHIFNVVFHV
jgi:hypothetical protein